MKEGIEEKIEELGFIDKALASSYLAEIKILKISGEEEWKIRHAAIGLVRILGI